MSKVISDNKLTNIYLSDNDKLKENIDIDILKKKIYSIENKNKKKKKIKFYNKILDYQKKQIVDNQHIIDKQNNTQIIKGGKCNIEFYIAL